MAAILVNFSVLALIIGISTLIKGCCKLREAQAAAAEVAIHLIALFKFSPCLPHN